MDTKAQVKRLLKGYHDIKQNLDILKFQIAHFSGLSYDEVITALTFTNPEGERVQNNSVSDKSARIALIYQDLADSESEEILRGMLKQYHTQKRDLDMFEYCITLLEQRLSEVITDMVINRMAWDAMGDKYQVSRAMLGKYRDKAVGEITKMFEFSQVV